MPGRMPIQVPMKDDRIMLTAWRFRSRRLISTPRLFTSALSGSFPKSRQSLMIWLTANVPISTGSSCSPPFSMYQSKVRRGMPVAGSTPGIETSIPSRPEISPLTRDPSLTEAISTIAIMISVKYSNGPNLVARIDSGLVTVNSTPQATSPPTKDAVIPRPRARPGRPERAIG